MSSCYTGNAATRHQAKSSICGQRSRASRQPRHVKVVALLQPTASPEVQKSTNDDLKKLSLVTALKTPYLTNGRFDLRAYDKLVNHQIANGVQAVIVGGTTGEGHLMDWDEHVMLIAHTVNNFGDKVKVIGNTGSNSTREAIHATEQGFGVGMHAALQINPYYGKTSKSGLLGHFRAVLNEGPAIIYNVPGRTGQDIPDDVVFEIAQHPNFLGMKECTGNKRILNYTSKGVNCWSGNDDECHAAKHEAGAAGVISVTSNVIPGLFSQMMLKGPNPELNNSLKDLYSWLFCEPNPIALNTALAMCGLVNPVFRLPYVPLDKEKRQKGAVLLEAVKEHIPGCQEIRVLEDSDFKLTARY